jgi:hypothetical protein
LALDLRQKIQLFEHGLSGLHAVIYYRAHEGGSKESHAAIAVDEFRIIAVVGRPGEHLHLGGGFDQSLTWNLASR